MTTPTEQTVTSEAEARYRALFETMGPAVLLMRGAQCIDCNPATLALFGLDSREEFIGKSALDFAPEFQPNGVASAELVQRNVIEAIQHGSVAFEWQSLRKNGEPFLMEVRFALCGPPQDMLFLCIAVDISERRRAELALQVSEQRFRTLVERASEGLLVADAETRQIRYANPAICELLGFTADELQHMRADQLHPPESVPMVIEGLKQQAAGAQSEDTLTFLRKDGSLLVTSIRGARFEFDGRHCVAGFITDLTERRQAEAERLRAQKLEALGALAGGIAHDFNNLLQGVFGYISAAKVARSAEQSRHLLEESEQALRMAARLTNQLLTFSRGGTPLTKVVSLAPLVERAAKFALSGSRVAAVFDLAADLWAVEADEGQLEQVIQNIVLNAAQASGPGATITVRAFNATAPSRGLPAHLPPGRYAAVTMEDRGGGIDSAHLSRIFDPYFTTKTHGSGLGLATAYSVVRNHRGAIDVQSELGAGSRFTVYLPGHDVPVVDTLAPAQETNVRTIRALVMDDDAMVRRVTAELLAVLGHEVEVAEDGAVAVERFREAHAARRPFDVVIVDLTVPGGMGGLEALVHLKAIDPQARVVLSSGYSDDAVIAEHRKHGFSAALRKPFTLDMLASVLAGTE